MKVDGQKNISWASSESGRSFDQKLDGLNGIRQHGGY